MMAFNKYWIDPDILKVWFKAGTLPAKTTKFFDVWKQGAQSPSIDDTMVLGDDFNGSSLDTVKWNRWLTGGTTQLSNGELIVSSSGNWETVGSKTQYTYPMVFEYKAKSTDLLGASKRFSIGIDDRTSTGSAHGSSLDVAKFHSDESAGRVYIAVRNGSITNASRGVLLTQYNNLKIVWESNRVRYYINDTLMHTITTNVPLDNCGVEFDAMGNTITVDHCFVRKYAAIEPVVTVVDMGSFYRVYVYNPNTTALTDYQVAVNASDLGVTSTTESIEITETPSEAALSYWPEGIATGDRTWFKIPKLPANATKTYALVKKSGYSPSGDDTFEFFDDFLGSALNALKWNTATAYTGDITVSSSEVAISTGASTSGPYARLISAQTFAIDTVAVFKLYRTQIGLGNMNERYGYINEARTDWVGYYGNQISVNKFVATLNSQETAYSYNVTTNTYKKIGVTRDGNIARYAVDNTPVTTIDSNVPQSNLPLQFMVQIDSGYNRNLVTKIDWVHVRKYTTVEPTVTVVDKQGYYLITVTNNTATELTDYQVSVASTDIGLTSITESLEITETDVESAKYWIEDVTTNTWVKVEELLPFETRMYEVKKTPGYAPSGSDVMMEFFDGDSTGWTEVDPNGHISFVNNRLEFTNLNRGEDAYVYKAMSNANDDLVIEYTWKYTAGANNGLAMFGIISDTLDDANNFDNGIRSFNAYTNNTGAVSKRVSDVATDGNVVSYSGNTQYWNRTTIDRAGNAVTKVYSNAARTTLVTTSTVSVTNIPSTLQYLIILSSFNSAGATSVITGWIDDFRIRKYASVEPTVVVEDMGTWYKVSITNNVGETLTDYQVAIPSSELGISSVDDSLQILPIHRSQQTAKPYADLFENCVAYWDFMGDANDVIGTANGTVSGATLTTDRFGIQNAAYDFDGVNDQIVVPHSSIHNVNNITLIALINPDTYGTLVGAAYYGRLIAKRQNSPSMVDAFDFFIYDYPEGGQRYAIAFQFNGQSTGIYVPNVVELDKWQLFAVTYDGSNVRFYKDGNKVGTIANSTGMSTNTTDILIGNLNGFSRYFNGKMAMVAMFSDAKDDRWNEAIAKLLQRGYIYPIMRPRRLIE